MIRILRWDGQGEVNTNLQMENLAEALKDPAGLLWLDMSTVSVETAEHILVNTFRFHPLAIDDALHESHVPKIDDWQQYLYIVLRAARHTSDDGGQYTIPEQDIFLGPSSIVTYSLEPIAAVDRVWRTNQKDRRWNSQGFGYLLYRLVDEFASEAIEVVEEMENELELLEDQIFSEANPVTLERLFTLKRSILQLRRIMTPQREVVSKLARNEYAVIEASDRIFFRDVYDHLLRLDTLLDDLVILVGGARDSYLSVVNNRMNEVMKTLTVITAFFMPLAFITGFFGMNFFQAILPLEAWTSRLAFIAVLTAMALIPFTMFLWMRRRAWI